MKIQNQIAMAFALFTTAFASLMRGYRLASLLSAVLAIVWVLVLLVNREETSYSWMSLLVLFPFLGCFSLLLQMGYQASSHLASLLLLEIVFLFLCSSLLKTMCVSAKVDLLCMVGVYVVAMIAMGLFAMSVMRVDALQYVGYEVLLAKDVMPFYSMFFFILCVPCSLCMFVAIMESRMRACKMKNLLVVTQKM